ncbi:MAG: hypothetical protein MH825_08125 [Cyanobacteria bacterium]|nr:hypothetical protein [Cyanobacteriota bacterium]
MNEYTKDQLKKAAQYYADGNWAMGRDAACRAWSDDTGIPMDDLKNRSDYERSISGLIAMGLVLEAQEKDESQTH